MYVHAYVSVTEKLSSVKRVATEEERKQHIYECITQAENIFHYTLWINTYFVTRYYRLFMQWNSNNIVKRVFRQSVNLTYVTAKNYEGQNSMNIIIKKCDWIEWIIYDVIAI